VAGAQQHTINFTNNNLLGSANFLPGYKTSKARVCVTVGMMTTGYDCPDLLNLALMRPIYSPTDFIQIKGRGTRTHNHSKELVDEGLKRRFAAEYKTRYKLFDFFANCEYFETQYKYDEVLKLPRPHEPQPDAPVRDGPVVYEGDYESDYPDILVTYVEKQIGEDGMRVDRMMFQRFEQTVTADEALREMVLNEQWDRVDAYVRSHIMDKPEEYFTLDKLRHVSGVNRRVSLREIVEKAYGRIPRFKTTDELLDEEFAKFLAEQAIGEYAEATVTAVPEARAFFYAYLTDGQLRDIIDSNRLADLNTNSSFGMQQYKAVPAAWRTRIPEYVKDYVPLNKFLSS
jgi:type I restriction enzyme R subunit